MIPEVEGRHVLLLQGPMGPFFARVARDLRARGARVSKVNFNSGDWIFYPRDSISFRAPLETWPAWLRAHIEAEGVDIIALFGDMRPIHRAAIEVAETHGVPVYVFEEGYLRPDHITCEPHGVNGNSRMSRDPDFYRAAALTPRDDVKPVGPTFTRAAIYATFYSLALTLVPFPFPHYRHHRRLDAPYHIYSWCHGAARKLWFQWLERHELARLRGELSGRFFLVPLQVHCDAQLLHSGYEDMPTFIDEVANSFAAHAPSDVHLLVKHHPADRPFRDYSAHIAKLRRTTGLGERLHYVHDLHLPTLLRHTAGTVTINSTVGLSSIHHAAPTKVMGDAVYDMPGLTHQGELAEFWQNPGEVDLELYTYFRGWLEQNNQFNGSIWRYHHSAKSPPERPARQPRKHLRRDPI